MARNTNTPDCAIKGCSRAAGKSGLCELHYQFVPFDFTLALACDIAASSHRAAKRAHKVWQRYVQERVGAGLPPARGTYAGSEKWQQNTRNGAKVAAFRRGLERSKGPVT